MSVIPVISTPNDIMSVPTLTVFRFSGFDSQVGPGDKEIIRWYWDFGDGGLAAGPECYHVFDTPGTKTVTLTVIGDNFSQASISINVTVNNFTGRIFYVSSSTGNDNGPGTAAFPWKTIDKVIASTNNGQKNNPDAVLFKRGDAWTSSKNISMNAPTLWLPYGSGDAPLINMADKTQFYVLDGAGGIPDNQYGYSIYVHGLHIKWATRQTGDNGGVALFTYGSQLVDCNIENGPVVAPAGTEKVILRRTTVSGANGAGFFTSGNYSALINCKLVGNGNDAIFHHQFYFSCSNYVLVIGCVCDGNGAIACSFGGKFSGVRKYYVFKTEVKNTNYGFDAGSNGAADNNPEGQDGLFDTCVIHNTGQFGASGGFWFSFMNRCTVKNCIFYDCDQSTGQAVLIFRGNNSSELTQNIRILNCTFFSNQTQEYSFEHDAVNITFMNNIVYRNKGANLVGDFIGTTPGTFVADYNVYISTNASGPDDKSLFKDGNGKAYSFHDWQNQFGQDIHGIYGDPKFLNGQSVPPDLHLGGGSVAKDMGLSLPVVWNDYDNKDRIGNVLYDAGVYLA